MPKNVLRFTVYTPKVRVERIAAVYCILTLMHYLTCTQYLAWRLRLQAQRQIKPGVAVDSAVAAFDFCDRVRHQLFQHLCVDVAELSDVQTGLAHLVLPKF